MNRGELQNSNHKSVAGEEKKDLIIREWELVHISLMGSSSIVRADQLEESVYRKPKFECD